MNAMSDLSRVLCRTKASVRDGNVQLAFGESEDGRILHISQVESGLACRCVCPGCKDRLVARKGLEKAPHFAHHGEVPCGHALESALHKLAKEVLDERRELLLPEISATLAGETLLSFEARTYRFDEARLETSLGDIVPDVIVRRGKNQLLVEMFVTHRCGPEKIERIRAKGLSCVEIDLRALPRSATREQVEEALLSGAPRQWIYNPRMDETEALLCARIAQREADAKALAERKAADEARRLDALAERIKAAIAGYTPPRGGNAEAGRKLGALGLGYVVGREIAGNCWFTVDDAIWQGMIVERWIVGLMKAKSGVFASFHPTDVFKDLKTLNLLRPDLPLFLDRPTERALRARIPEFRSPYQVVEAYLDLLYRYELLALAHSKRWSLSQASQRIWTDYCGREKLREERENSVRGSVARMLRRIPEKEHEGFDVDRWYCLVHLEFDASFAEAIERDDNTDYSHLNRQLGLIEAMVLRSGDPVQNLLGLPLHWERQRARDRKQAEADRQAREAAESLRRERNRRLSTLQQEAERELDLGSKAWLNTIHPQLAGVAPIEAAELSAAGLTLALRELRRDADARREKLRLEALVSRLEQAADHMRRPAHARLFLKTCNPRWENRRPIEFCRDEQSFHELKRAMAAIAN